MRTLLVSLVIASSGASLACAATRTSDLPSDVKSFLSLLTDHKEPTLSDYLAYYGQSAEDETALLLSDCKARNIRYDDCVTISNREAAHPNKVQSRYLKWIRSCYRTVGTDFVVTNSEHLKENGADRGFVYSVKVGSSLLRIQYVKAHARYDGLAVAIVDIDGMRIDSLLPKSGASCVGGRMPPED